MSAGFLAPASGELTDDIRILNILFLSRGEIPSPGIMEWGKDPTKDTFDESFGPYKYECSGVIALKQGHQPGRAL